MCEILNFNFIICIKIKYVCKKNIALNKEQAINAV